MVATLVRLRWCLTLNSLRANVWALIGTIVGALYGLGLLLALVAGAIGLGGLGADAAAPVLAAAGALTVLGWALVPLMLTGVDSTLDPRAMAAWTAPSRPLAIGLAVAAATGVPGVITGAGLLLPVLVWAVAGQWGAALATCVLLSRVVVIGAGVSTSRRGRDRAGVIAVLAILLVSLAPSLLNLGARLDSIDLEGLRTAARVAGLTPFGWALAAPGHLARGEAAAAIGLSAAALALPAALAPVWERVVGRVMTGPARSDAHSRAYDGAAEGGAQAGAGAAGTARVLPWHRRLERVMPSPAAAVAARCLRYWRADPRYLVQAISLVVMPVLLAVMIAMGRTSIVDAGETASLAPGRAPAVLLAAPVLAALLSGWGLHNDLAFDSTALWTQVSASVRGRDDRLGRIAAAALWQAPVIAVLALGGGAWTGLWRALPAVGGLSAALYGCALAWSSLTGVLLPYEVNAPGDSPMKSRTSGTAFIAALVQMVGMGVIGLAAAPVIAGFAVMALAGAWGWGWPFLAAGALWGAGAAWAGIAVGGRLLDSRGVRILTTIRSWPGHEEAR